MGPPISRHLVNHGALVDTPFDPPRKLSKDGMTRYISAGPLAGHAAVEGLSPTTNSTSYNPSNVTILHLAALPSMQILQLAACILVVLHPAASCIC